MKGGSLESLLKALDADPMASILGVGLTLTWLRIMRDLRAVGLSWEDAVCVCVPTTVADAGLILGIDFVHRDIAPDVVARWDRREVIEEAVRDGALALRAILGRDGAAEDERLVGIALYAAMLQAIPEGGRTVREQGGDALGYALAVLAAVEVDPDEQGFPVRFRGHVETVGRHGIGIAIPRLYRESFGGAS